MHRDPCYLIVLIHLQEQIDVSSSDIPNPTRKVVQTYLIISTTGNDWWGQRKEKGVRRGGNWERWYEFLFQKKYGTGAWISWLYAGRSFTCVQHICHLTPCYIDDEAVRAIYENWHTDSNDVYLVSFPNTGHHLAAKLCVEIMCQASQYYDRLDYYPNHRVVGGITSVPSLYYMYSKDGGFEPRINQFLKDTEKQIYRFYRNHTNPLIFSKLKNLHRNTKFVITVRNPKDTFVSWYFFLKSIYDKDKEEHHNEYPEYIEMNKFFRHFMNGIVPYNHFWDFYIAWQNHAMQHLDPNNVLWLRYEDIVSNKRDEVVRICRFLGVDKIVDEKEVGSEEKERMLGEIEEHTSFQTMKEATIQGQGGLYFSKYISANHFFREGKVGNWREYLTAEQSEEVDLVTRTLFHGIPVLSSYSDHPCDNNP